MDDVDDAGGVDELGNEDVCKKERETGNAGAAPVLPATTTMSPLTVKSILSACSSMGACMHARAHRRGSNDWLFPQQATQANLKTTSPTPVTASTIPGPLLLSLRPSALLPPTTFL